MSITTVAAAAAVLIGSATAQLYPISSENHTCAIQPAYKSCSPKAVPENVDTCCVETFGGLVLQTQVSAEYQMLNTNTDTTSSFGIPGVKIHCHQTNLQCMGCGQTFGLWTRTLIFSQHSDHL